jgi:tryptophan synthase
MSAPLLSADVAAAFAAARAENRPAFIPFITGGYPSKACTVPALLAMQQNGADILEVGIPFSDPIADGGTIQAANQVALDNGVTLEDCLGFVAEARAQGLTVPVIFMGYFNPFLQFGEAALVQRCADVGVHGFIIPDLPPQEARVFRGHCDTRDLCLVPLVSPTTTEARLATIAQLAKGYVYCVSLNGVTGARTELPPHLNEFLERVRKHVDCPLAVGFGLSTRSHVKAVGKLADGAIMGSAVIKALTSGGDDTAASVAAVGAFCYSVTHDA